MGTKQSMKSQQTKGKLSPTMFFHVGSHFWQPWAFNGVSLCICQLLCSSGALTHCGSLSDQINVAFLCNAATSETHHRHSYTLRNPNSLCTNTQVLSLIVGCPQSANDPGIKEREQRTQRPAVTFSPWVKCQNNKKKKNFDNWLVGLSRCSLGCSLEAPLTDTLQLVEVEMRLELLIRPIGGMFEFVHNGGTLVLQQSKIRASSSSQFSKF